MQNGWGIEAPVSVELELPWKNVASNEEYILSWEKYVEGLVIWRRS